MTRRRGATLLFATALAGCGSVSSPDSPGEPVMVVTAKLSSTPPIDLDTSNLRATLVWTNGLGLDYLTTLDCQAETDEQLQECQRALMGQMEVSSSDVQVEMEFPLRVRLELYELPTPIRGQFQDNLGWRGIEKGIYHSVPEGELVLYEDGNGNGRFDLLPIGKAGPGPDRVVALSSGRDPEGRAVRTSVVYKAGRILPIGAYMPLLPEQTFDDESGEAKFDGPNGVFAFKQIAEVEQALGGEALLSEHSLVSEPIAGDLPYTVTPIEEATIQLFTVEPGRRSWLARGCERLPQTFRGRRPLEKLPVGVDVQCGSGVLAFASHPDNHCGQVEILMAVDEQYQPSTPSWWPCDANGMKADTDYHAASERLDALPLYGERMEARMLFGKPPGASTACEPGVFYDFGDVPLFRMPTVAPPPGSQVFCRSPESLSYVPPPADDCAYKFRYDLRATQDDFEGFGTFQLPTWDWRENPPSWWPCNENGELRADSGYVAPVTEQIACTNEPFVQQPMVALEPGTRIRCESPDELVYLRDWVGACEQEGQQMAVRGEFYDDDGQSIGSWSNSKPRWWPCDSDGNLAGDRYLPL